MKLGKLGQTASLKVIDFGAPLPGEKVPQRLKYFQSKIQ